MKIFLSYCFADDSFIQRVYYLLRTQPNLLAFYYSADKRAGPFPDRIKREITQATGFVAFLGEQLGGVQQEEIQHALDLKKRVVFVYLRSEASIDPIGRRYVKDKYDPVRLSSIEEPGRRRSARGKLLDFWGSGLSHTMICPLAIRLTMRRTSSTRIGPGKAECEANSLSKVVRRPGPWYAKCRRVSSTQTHSVIVPR
jgi:hypothetical protein